MITAKKIFLLTFSLLLIASLGLISATNITDTADTQNDITYQTQQASNNQESIQTDTTHTETINKTIQTNTKESKNEYWTKLSDDLVLLILSFLFFFS